MFRKLFRRRAAKSPIDNATLKQAVLEATITVDEVAVLEVLSMFATLADPERRVSGEWRAIWSKKLGTSFASVTDALQEKGLLRHATRTERILHLYTLEELKTLARERGLKVSGRKADLAQRIINDESFARPLNLPTVSLIVCSDEALEEVRKHKSAEKASKEAVKELTRNQLKAGQLMDACKTVCNFELNSFFPRGLGVDWATEHARLVHRVKRAFEELPSFHKRRFGEDLSAMRVGAAMGILWGEPDLPDVEGGFPAGLWRDQIELYQRMLEFHSNYLSHLSQIKGLAAQGMKLECEIIAVDDANTTCNACRSEAGKIYLPDKVPELPHEYCKCDIGCRCGLIASVKEVD